MYKIRTPAAPALDERWHGRLKQLLFVMGETFETLMPSPQYVEKAYGAFMESGCQENPLLYPDGILPAALQEVEQGLTRLKNEISGQEHHEGIRAAYIERIDESLANIRMVQAAYAHDTENFAQANAYIYGKPDIRIYTAACQWLRQEAERCATDDSVPDDVAAAVLEVVPYEAEGQDSLMPSNDVFRRVQVLHTVEGGYFEQLFAGLDIPESGIVDEQLGDLLTQQVIANIGSDYELQESTNGLWAVIQNQKRVLRPQHYELTSTAFKAIITHEVGCHLLEYTNGADAGLRLLELGLDRYEAGNEGRAVLREQLMYTSVEEYIRQPQWFPTKASWEYRVAIHLVVSLASGITGRPYGFAEIYRVLTVLFRFWTLQRYREVDEAVISRGAWSMAVRVMKGTDGTGGAYLKDIVYLEGNVRCWQAVVARPELILFGDLGKFDIASERHILLLEDIGILPKQK
ncbi:MAG TPA: tyrosine/phenylalanine carboxypeptidase domain-containing protein [Candidatus Limnocylindrales bacterium]|nr:tyrosine/phenylalanine carboxypeptidase domain-containing protein [Candidatus Limnocylindrales bacterium]